MICVMGRAGEALQSGHTMDRRPARLPPIFDGIYIWLPPRQNMVAEHMRRVPIKNRRPGTTRPSPSDDSFRIGPAGLALAIGFQEALEQNVDG